jgi:hypothetical protein
MTTNTKQEVSSKSGLVLTQTFPNQQPKKEHHMGIGGCHAV